MNARACWVGRRRRSGTAAVVAAEADERGSACGSKQQSRHSLVPPPAPRPPARLFDQRLQISNSLLAVAVVLVIGRVGWRGDAQVDSSSVRRYYR
jgi:hypothetical protein